jgi:hypothetical protein
MQDRTHNGLRGLLHSPAVKAATPFRPVLCARMAHFGRKAASYSALQPGLGQVSGTSLETWS